MMRNDAVVNHLEELYHIQFGMTYDCENNIQTFRVYPIGEDLFSLVFSFRPTRVSIDLKTTVAGSFVRNMGRQPMEKRELFISHSKLIRDSGYKMNLQINGNSTSIDSPNTWPDEWNQIGIHITRILKEDEDDYEMIVEDVCPIIIGMMLSLTELEPNDSIWNHMEGAEKERWIRTYERNPTNRKICISAKGTRCIVCGLDFGEVYGPIGSGFIHVHHLTPVSRMKGPRDLNPLKDLVPVCPNCHYMLHRVDPPLTPNELQKIMKNSHKTQQ